MKSLQGKTVVVTRSEADADPLCVRLRALGAQVVQVPSVTLSAVPLSAALQHTLDKLSQVAWVACTSRHGAAYFHKALQAHGVPLPGHVRLAAVGPGTAQVMTQLWRAPDWLAEPATGEGLAACMLQRASPQAGAVLLPVGQRARRVVQDTLSAHGFTVWPLVVYHNEIASAADAPVPLPQQVDFVLFTSPSTVSGFLARQVLPQGAQVVTIGPTTSAAVRQRGLAVEHEAHTPSIEGLVDAVLGA